MAKVKKRILILSTKTGGGHRSSADAVIEVLKRDYSSEVEIIDVNFFEDYIGKPLGDMPTLYPKWVKIPKAWETFYKLTSTKKRASLIIEKLGQFYAKDIERLLNENDCDTIVSFHFAANAFLNQVDNLSHKPRFYEVVTDLVIPHPSWFDERIHNVMVATSQAKKAALSYGILEKDITITGLPINQAFFTVGSKVACRKSLGLDENKKFVLVMAGGDGMGKVKSLVRKLDKVNSEFEFIVVAGRNARLKKSLEKNSYKHKLKVYGYTNKIAQLMASADILFTKAGPSTLCEALTIGVPIVMYDFLPGQEEPNVDYIVENHAGIYAKTSVDSDLVLAHLLADEKARMRMSENAKALVIRNAAENIAKIITS